MSVSTGNSQKHLDKDILTSYEVSTYCNDYSLHPISTFYLTDGSDYETGPYNVTFTAGQMNATLMVSTVDDNTTELSENFNVMIISTDQPGLVVISSPNVSVITIEDNEPGNTIVSTYITYNSV